MVYKKKKLSNPYLLELDQAIRVGPTFTTQNISRLEIARSSTIVSNCPTWSGMSKIIILKMYLNNQMEKRVNIS